MPRSRGRQKILICSYKFDQSGSYRNRIFLLFTFKKEYNRIVFSVFSCITFGYFPLLSGCETEVPTI